MSAITTHVLDTARGRPAAGVPVRLETASGSDAWTLVAQGTTNADGRIADLLPAGQPLSPGTYRMTFVTEKVSPFFPVVHVVFRLEKPEAHYHIPLLLSPFGYSTYRGS